MPGLWLAAVGLTDDTPVSADLPAVEWAHDGIAPDLPIGQIGSEVGAIRVDGVHLPGGIAEHHPMVAGTLHEGRAVANVDRATDDVPSLRIRRRIG
jgi:hypothetical protein